MSNLIKCPICHKMVSPSHFTCSNVGAAGASGVGKAKRRGDAKHYQALGKKGAEKRWRKE